MSSGVRGASLTSKLAELIVVANGGGSSFVLNNDTQPALFIGTDSKVGVHTVTPTSQLSIVNDDGTCLSLHHGDSETAVANINVTSDGDLDLVSSAPGSKVKTSSLFDVVNHNGSSIGLKLGGQLVRATAEQLNYTAATPGTAVANKAVVLNGGKSVSGITTLSATNLSGTLQTPHQPNITSVGTLDSLEVTNDVSATTLSGTIQTAAQPNITSVGTLSSLTVTNGVTASSLTGAMQTAAQPNITSVGALSSVSIGGSTISAEAAFLSGAVAGTAVASKVDVLDSQKGISGIGTLSAATLTGTLQTSAQPNITSIGALASITIANSLIGSEAAFLSGAVAGTAAPSKALVLNGASSINGITSLSATSLSGTLQTAAQPNITSIGTLSALGVSGSVALTSTSDASGNASGGALTVGGGMAVAKKVYVGTDLYVSGDIYLQGSRLSSSGGSAGNSDPNGYLEVTTPGVAEASKALILDSASSVRGIGSLSATSITGTLQTPAQPSITSVGTLSTLSVSGVATLSSVTDATSSTAGGALTISGGAAVAKKMYVGSDLYVTGSIYMNGISVGVESPYLSSVTAGTAAAGKALILDSSSAISGISSMTTTTLAASGIVTLTNTTDSSSATTGALVVNGGAAIAKKLYVGGSRYVGGTQITNADPNGYLSGITAGTATASKALVLDSSSTISGIASLSTTALVVGGTSFGSAQAGYLSSITAGTAAASKALVLNSSGAISGITSLSATSITGAIQTAAQPLITSVGTLSTLSVNGDTTISSVTNATDASTGGALAVSGGARIVTDLYVGGTIYMNGTALTTGGSGGSSGDPNGYLTVTPGTATASKALVLDASKNISGIGRISTTDLVLNGGTLQETMVQAIGNGKVNGLTFDVAF